MEQSNQEIRIKIGLPLMAEGSISELSSSSDSQSNNEQKSDDKMSFDESRS